MRVGAFELLIRGADGSARPEAGEGHVPMAHGEVYAIEFRNHCGDRCNLNVLVDGASVGDFQIGPYQTGVLERPLNDRGRFTFFAAGSGEAQAAGEASVSSADKGLVQVTFTPGRERTMGFSGILRGPSPISEASDTVGRVVETRCASPAGGMMGAGPGVSFAMDFGAGMTGQTGYSGQEFGVARSIVEDPLRRAVITLRLVHDRARSLPGAVRPLPGRPASNPVPRPVG